MQVLWSHMDVTPVRSPPIYIYFSYFIAPGIRRRKQPVLFNSISFILLDSWFGYWCVQWGGNKTCTFTLQPNCTEIFFILIFSLLTGRNILFLWFLQDFFFALVLSFLGDFLTYYKFTYVFYKAKTLKQKKKNSAFIM